MKMTEAEVLAFIRECNGHIMLNDVNADGVAALADKGIVKIVETTERYKKKFLGHPVITTYKHVYLI